MNRALLFLLTAFSLLAQQTFPNLAVKTNLTVIGSAVDLSVDTVSELISLNAVGSNIKTVSVARYSTNVAVGVGAGTYVWSPSYSGTTNAYGGALAVAGGAWVLDGRVGIDDFGARPGDETYDNSTHINAAIDWFNGTIPPKGWPDVVSPSILIPAGDWNVNAGGVLLKEGITLEGEGEQGSELVITWANPITVSSLTQTAGVATLVSSSDHGLSSGDFIVITGASQSAYNDIHHVTVVDSVTLTFPIDSATVSPATGTLVCTAHPFGIQNWRESTTDEFASTAEKQSNFGIRNLTISVSKDTSPPEGVYALRLANTVEPKLKDVRFRMHRAPNGDANLASALWLELCDDVDIDNVSVDQGLTAIKASVRFGASYSLARGRFRNCFLFSQTGTALDLGTAFTSSFEGLMIANSGGDQSSNPNVQVSIDAGCYENKFDGLELERFANYGIVCHGDRNTFDGTHVYWSVRSSNTTYDKIGFDLYGDNNVLSDTYMNGAIVGVRIDPSATGNIIRGLVTLHSDTPVIGLTHDNVFVPDRNDAPSAMLNFVGISSSSSGAWIRATMADTIDAGEEFAIMLTCMSHGLPASSTAINSQAFVAIGSTSTPGSGGGAFRFGIDTFGRLFATFYGTTSSDRREWRTPTDSFPFGQRTSVYMARDSSGNVTFRVNGQLIEDLTVSTSGTAPGATDAITGNYVHFGNFGSSSTLLGWIGDMGVFNRPLTFGEQVEFDNGTLAASPALRVGKDETALNGTFESGTTGWAVVAGGLIAQTNVSHSGTYSLHVNAVATSSGVATSGQIANTSGLVTYLVEGYIRWVAGTGEWQIGRADSSDLQPLTVETDGDWHPFSVIVGGAIGQPSGVLRLLSANGAGTIDLDDVTVRRYGALSAFSAGSEITSGYMLAWDGATYGESVNNGIEQWPPMAKGAPNTRLLSLSGTSVTWAALPGQRDYKDFLDLGTNATATVNLAAAREGFRGDLLLHIDPATTCTLTLSGGSAINTTSSAIAGADSEYQLVKWSTYNVGGTNRISFGKDALTSFGAYTPATVKSSASALSYSGGTNITVTVPTAGAPYVINTLATTADTYITFSGSNAKATGELILSVSGGPHDLSFAGNVLKPASTTIPLSLTNGTWNLEWKSVTLGGTNFTMINVLGYDTP